MKTSGALKIDEVIKESHFRGKRDDDDKDYWKKVKNAFNDGLKYGGKKNS